MEEKCFSGNLFYYSNIMRGDSGIMFSCWLISAHKEECVLMTIRDMLFYYWKHNNHLYHYFIYHFFGTMALEMYPEVSKKVSILSNVPPHIMQLELNNEYNAERFEEYKSISNFHKLTYKLDKMDKGSNYYKILGEDE